MSIKHITHHKVRAMLIDDVSPSLDQISAMMGSPLECEAVHLSLLVLRHTVNQTVQQLTANHEIRIAALEKEVLELRKFKEKIQSAFEN